MLVNEILNEAIRQLPIGNARGDAEKIAQLIERTCSEMIQVYQQTNGRPLFRGMRNLKKDSAHVKIDSKNLVSSIRKNRQPVEMNREQHVRLEKLFTEAGLKANRTNSIFCTASYNIATDWGNDVKLIFVKDGWTGTVFESGENDYSFYDLQYVETVEELKKLKPTVVNQQNLPKIIMEEYVDILITGSSYVALSFSNFGLIVDVFKLLNIPVGYITNLSSRVN